MKIVADENSIISILSRMNTFILLGPYSIPYTLSWIKGLKSNLWLLNHDCSSSVNHVREYNYANYRDHVAGMLSRASNVLDISHVEIV